MADSHPRKFNFLFAKNKSFEKDWPFLEEELLYRLGKMGTVEVLEIADEERDTPLAQLTDLKDYIGIAWFAGGFDYQTLVQAKRLKMIGCMKAEVAGALPTEALMKRDVVVIDAGLGLAHSIAECGLGLLLCALRRLPQWHRRMKNREPLWDFKYTYFCDDGRFVNGDLGTKKVGIVGLGPVGSRMAKWVKALGAPVYGYDPFIPPSVAKNWGVELADMDKISEVCRIVVIAVPDAPGSRNLLNADRINKLRKGSLVAVVTSAQAVDMLALRQRILNDELAGAFDVYDVEPLPVDDSLRDRSNVIHLPHIGPRTRDGNIRVADVISEDFERILRDEEPSSAMNVNPRDEKTAKIKAPTTGHSKKSS